MKNSKVLIAVLVTLINFKFSNSFTINCGFESSGLNSIGNVYTCGASNFPNLSGDSITKVNGTHKTGKTNSDVEAIWIVGSWKLNFFPHGFGKFFPKVKAIIIYDLAVEYFYGDELDEFPNLEWIRIWNSNLTTISSKLFEKTPKLNFIDISFTSLERVGRDLFKPLNATKLKWIDFSLNRCIHRSATDGNQNSILSLINELKVKCPLDEEENLTCSARKIDELVCELRAEVKGVQENLMLDNERLDKLESRVKWLESEIIRISTNSCACK